MKKYLMSLAALMIAMTATVLTSCSKDIIDEIENPEVVTPETGTHVETLTIAFPEQPQTRVAMDGDHNLTGWEEGDEVTLVRTYYEVMYGEFGPEWYIFNVEDTYTFTCTNAANGTFTGTMPDPWTVEDCQLAFYNATGFDTDGSSSFYFSPKTRASQNMKDVVMLVAKNDGEGNFDMEIFGSILQVTNNTGADITASVKYSWFGCGRYYDCNEIVYNDPDFGDFGTNIGADVNHQITLSKDAPTYVYIPVYDLDGGNAQYAVGLSAAGDAEDECSIVPFKTNPGNAKLFKKTLEAAAWENALSLGKSFSNGATSIEIQTGVNVSSYTVDATHKSLNAAGTLWEFLDGEVLRIQTSSNRIIAPVNSSGLFRKYYIVESIANLNKLDMSGVTDMSSMFADCYELTSIALPVNTGSVTDMNHMFYNCEKLQSITGIDNLNTGSVTNMSSMFRDCPALSALDVTHFDTQNVTDMSEMFNGCVSLSALDVTHFDTQNVSNMGGMFAYCSALTELDVTNFDTQKVTDMSFMFCDCKNLSALDVAYFNTSNVTDMSGMFDNCQTLESLDITSFDTRSVENMEGMFDMCLNLTSLRIGGNFSMSNVTNKWNMFQFCGYEWRSFRVSAVNNDDWELEDALTYDTGWEGYMQFEKIWE